MARWCSYVRRSRSEQLAPRRPRYSGLFHHDDVLMLCSCDASAVRDYRERGDQLAY